MLDARESYLVAETAPALPVGAMLRGKSRAEAAELLPRLFNLCRSAQSLAARMALGLPDEGSEDALRYEILRDHVMRLTMILPGHFGQNPISLPTGWQSGCPDLGKALFGPRGRLPDRPSDFAHFCQSSLGVSLLFKRLAGMFAPDEAASDALPFVSLETASDRAACVENSCAARVADHPVVNDVATRHGRGPLWRVVARVYDLQALLDGTPLLAHAPSPGVAHVPATRGLYTVAAKTEGDSVRHFVRVTPTDHLQAKGGVLDQTLSSLPADRSALAPLVIDILDPCSPVRVKEVTRA